MFRKLWISGLAVGLAVMSTVAPADDNRDGYRYDSGRYGRERDTSRYADGGYDYARVLNVSPLRRRIRISEPVRECWDEPVYESNGPLSPRHAGSTLLGGIIGGVVGNQIGAGRGRDAARVAGVIIGGAIGNNVSHERQRQQGDYDNERLVERCEVHYRDSWDERIDGYLVTYECGGRDYTTRMPYDPGERVRIRIAVTPVGG